MNYNHMTSHRTTQSMFASCPSQRCTWPFYMCPRNFLNEGLRTHNPLQSHPSQTVKLHYIKPTFSPTDSHKRPFNRQKHTHIIDAIVATGCQIHSLVVIIVGQRGGVHKINYTPPSLTTTIKRMQV